MIQREQLLTALKAALNQIEATKDFSISLDPKLLEEASHLESQLGNATLDLEAQYYLGWFHWCRYLALPEDDDEDRADLEQAIDMFIPCFVMDFGSLPPHLLQDIAHAAIPIASRLMDKADREPDTDYISETVDIWQRIVDALPDDHPLWGGLLTSLGAMLRIRFERTGEIADLHAAVKVSKRAVDATAESEFYRSGVLSNFSLVMRLRYEWAGEPADLDSAVDSAQAAVDAASADDESRPIYLSAFASALDRRFRRDGNLADMNRAVEAIRAAAEAAPAGDPRHALYLSNLALTLRARAAQVGELADFDAAVEAARAAVDAASEDLAGRPRYLTNLGIALKARFERTGVLADLAAAVEAAEQAGDAAPPDHPERAARMANLAGMMQLRYEQTHQPDDLDAALSAARASVEATPSGDPARAGNLGNMAAALLARFRLTGELADVDEAISLMRTAADCVGGRDPTRTQILFNLGLMLETRFRRTAAQADFDAAVTSFTTASGLPAGVLLWRIRAARSGAALLASRAPGRAADLLEGAIRLLGEAAFRPAGRSDQQHAIAEVAGLANDTAALALADTEIPPPERAARALRYLEAGRAVLLSQALDTRHDLTELRQQRPGLAEQLTGIWERIAQTEDTSILHAAETANPGQASERVREDRLQLAQELADVLARIRMQDGFATFGLPPTARDLIAQAADGAIVTFNISSYRSDALLLTKEGITFTELPELSLETVADKINSFHEALHSIASAGLGHARRIAAERILSDALEWLWEAAARPVLDALGYCEQPSPGIQWPRIWWATGGLLGLLPIHAAGYHIKSTAQNPGRQTVMDRVISSYIPTIRALGYARQRALSAGPVRKSLIVAVPDVPGLPDAALPGVPYEVARLRPLLPDPVVLVETGLSGLSASGSAGIPTKASVLAHLPSSSVVHFSCHGVSDPADPSQSSLLLHDHGHAPFTVASLASINLDHAQLAYLSACRTAFTGTAELLDEAIHLTTAFQLAGFPHVIGTLWDINDYPAAEIAGAFYSRLTGKQDTLSLDEAASALHFTVRTIRDDLPDRPSIWAAYLHAGA